MTIARNYGPNNASVFGVNMAGAMGEENNKRLQELMALLAQLRGQNMDNELSQDRLALDKSSQELNASQFDRNLGLDQQRLDLDKQRADLEKQRTAFDTRTFNTIDYQPRSQPTLAERNQQLAAWRQR